MPAPATFPLADLGEQGGHDLAACSLQDLLRAQIAAAEHVIATSKELQTRLGDQPEGPLPQTPARSPELGGGAGPVSALASHLRPKLRKAKVSAGSGKESPCAKGGAAPAAPAGGDLVEPLLKVSTDVAPELSRENSDEVSTPRAFVRRLARKLSGVRHRAIFPDTEELKEQLKKTIDVSAYDVEELYKTVGCWQRLARNSYFKNLTFLVIALNSLWIAIDTDYNKAAILTDAPWEFQVGENLFTLYFSFEIFTRFMSFKNKKDAFSDGWFVFDLSLVLLMAWSTWLTPLIYTAFGGMGGSSIMQNTSIFRILRLFRLTRVARLARLLKDMPELMVLIKGMVFAIRAVFSTLCLLTLVIYVFAIMFTELLSDAPVGKGCFQTVPMSMNCLLLNGVFADQAQIIGDLLAAHWAYYVCILVYMVIGSLTILNMLIGVMCEVVQLVSEAEKDTMKTQSFKDKISKIVKQADTDGDMVITKDEFRFLVQSQDAMQALSEVNIDVLMLVDFADVIFKDSPALAFDEFVDSVLTFRNDNTATVKDLVDQRRCLMDQIEALME